MPKLNKKSRNPDCIPHTRNRPSRFIFISALPRSLPVLRIMAP